MMMKIQESFKRKIGIDNQVQSSGNAMARAGTAHGSMVSRDPELSSFIKGKTLRTSEVIGVFELY